MKKYTEDDYCDIYEKKICDNCGKCLEMQGIDTKAIKIEDIAKTVEENKVLEEEFKKELEAEAERKRAEEEQDNTDFNAYEKLQEAYKKFSEENNIDLSEDDYEDAFDHIDYEAEENLYDEGELEEMTEEIFPGVRVLKKKTK
ncbi:MAG: hypothetical protein E7214_09660 [Clostridium sp.]|nr:hypothetical protein [Clostridium sp.]